MADVKELYELGETPPLGHVPKQMYASLIRPSRFGEPKDAFEVEVIDVPRPSVARIVRVLSGFACEASRHQSVSFRFSHVLHGRII